MTGDLTTKWIRWIARVIGSLATVWWLLIGAIEVVWPHAPGASLEGAILAGLMGTTMLGVFIAWWREGIGGAIAAIGAIALCIFAYIAAGHNKAFAMLVSGGPFLAAGILFLTSWWSSRK